MSETQTIKIISRSGAVLGEWLGANIKEAMQNAVSARANLGGANLVGANLRGANLRGADLDGADMVGADLEGADLLGADLDGADLRGANLGGHKLDGRFLQLGPIGSRSDFLLIFGIEGGGLLFRAGCFTGTREEFVAALGKTHGDASDAGHARHLRDYSHAVALAEVMLSEDRRHQ